MEPQWKIVALPLLIFALCLNVNASSNRQKYGGRVLNIAPSDCTSPKFPNVTGTCMISLECQQRSGTVIGACRDGLLFGACCHDANAVVTTQAPEVISSTEPSTTITTTTKKFETLPIQNAISGFLKIQTATSQKPDSQKIDQTTQQTSSAIPVQDQKPSIKTSMRNSLRSTSEMTEAHTTADTTISTVSTSTTTITNSPVPVPNDHISDNNVKTSKIIESILESETASEIDKQSTTSTEPTTTKQESIVTRSSSETTTTENIVSPTTKFFYGKIKYSPKPMKFRLTTIKTVYTRPPTTETSYKVFSTSEEEDEDDRSKPARRPTQRVTTSVPVSTEAVTSNLPEISEENTPSYQKSAENVTAIPSVNQNSSEETTVSFSSHKSTEEVSIPLTEEITTPSLKSTEEFSSAYQKSTEEITTPYQKSTTLETLISDATVVDVTETTAIPIESPKTVTESLDKAQSHQTNASIPQKNVRIVNPPMSHRIGDFSDDESSNSNSAGWDNKLDEFVNQVVEGIAEELDKSNIDDVVFKSSSTTSTTTTTSTTAKPILKSEKVALKRKKSKPKGNSTRRRGSSKQKQKPKKKVTISTNGDSAGVVLDYRKDCGVRPLAVRKSRIVGGTPSNYGSWPWHALVKETVWWGIFSKIKCGGVLIGARHVLTAAHCQPQQTGKLSVVLGVTDSDNPNTNAVTKGVRRVIRHPQFNPRSYENDIAVLELDSPVEFQPHIVPICLPDLKEIFEGSEGFVTGMGLLRHDGERPLVLHEVDVPILNNSDCQSMFRRSGNNKPIIEQFLCAGYPQGLKDSCGGDSGSYQQHLPMRNYRSDEPSINETVTEFFSGGPLSVQRSNGQWVLAGTVSHGIKCAMANQPGIYMRTTWYLPWIEKVTRTARGRESSKCNGHPGTCDYPHTERTQPKGILDTLFRVFRLARRFWSRK